MKPKETVRAFDPLCEVQSDKASVEITSPYEGVVRELLVQEGEIAKVGAGLCLIEVTEEDSSSVSEEPAVATFSSSPNTSDERPLAVDDPRMHHPINPQYASENAGASLKDILATSFCVPEWCRSRSVGAWQREGWTRGETRRRSLPG